MRRLRRLFVVVRGAILELDVVRRHKAKVAVVARQDPVGVRGVVNGKLRIFGEGELLVGLSGVVVQSSGLAYWLDLGGGKQEQVRS